MPAKPKLDPEIVNVELAKLDGWELIEDGGAIFRKFKFDDFKEAFAFMTKIADVAEAIDHHPDWFNVYNRVEVKLSTHDVKGLTELDFELARAMDREFAK